MDNIIEIYKIYCSAFFDFFLTSWPVGISDLQGYEILLYFAYLYIIFKIVFFYFLPVTFIFRVAPNNKILMMLLNTGVIVLHISPFYSTHFFFNDAHENLNYLVFRFSLFGFEFPYLLYVSIISIAIFSTSAIEKSLSKVSKDFQDAFLGYIGIIFIFSFGYYKVIIGSFFTWLSLIDNKNYVDEFALIGIFLLMVAAAVYLLFIRKTKIDDDFPSASVRRKESAEDNDVVDLDF